MDPVFFFKLENEQKLNKYRIFPERKLSQYRVGAKRENKWCRYKQQYE